MFRKVLKKAVVFVALSTVCITANASSVGELKTKKEETQKKKEQAEATLNELKEAKSGILDTIAKLDTQIADYENEMIELNARIEQLNADIEVKQAELEQAKIEEEKQYDAMKLRIQYAYENGNVGVLDSIFTSSDLSDMVNKSEYVDQVYKYDKNMLAELISIKDTIDKCEQALKEELDDVEEIQAEVEENKEAVEYMKEGKETQLLNFESSIGDYQTLIDEYVKDMQATEAAIAEAEKASEVNYDVPISYTGGTFQWPVSTGGVITSTFGPRWGTIHRGLDIGCSEGTPIVAGESGVVTISQYSSSAGNFVAINHGGGVSTVYMHNSQLLVSVGQTVSRGDVIALSGNTGNSTGPHCHFAVSINGTYVDPLPYLQ